MIKLLIVSSLKSKELGEFLAQRGTFEIYKCYDSLSNNVADIQNSIVKVDKMLYLYQLDDNGNSNINIRSDMQLLQTMLLNAAFFSPGEIVFMTQDDEQCKQAERYFISVMESCHYKNYSIKKIEEKISFSAVYSSLMGITENASFRNVYKPLWRAERGSDSSFAYEAQDDSDLLLEPFVFDNLKKYQQQKNLAAKTSSTFEVRDSTELGVEKFKSPVFGQIDIDESPIKANVSILTGKSKSGLSIWTSALAVSAKHEGKSVLVIDYTSNKDVMGTLESYSIDFTKLKMQDLLRGFAADKDLFVCKARNEREDDVRLDFVRYYVQRGVTQFDEVLIAVDRYLFNQVYNIVKGQINKILLTVVPKHADVVELQRYVNLLKGEDIVILMNECVKMGQESFLEPQGVKDLLVFFNPKVVQSIQFDSLQVKGNLYNKILRREGN